MTLLELLGRYTDYQRYERHYSEHTLNATADDWQRFITWCDAESLAAPAVIEDIHPKKLRLYLMQLHREGLSPRSIARHLSSLRGAFEYAVKQSWLMHNPALGLQAPKRAKTLPVSVSADRLQACLDQPAAPLHQAMIELFYGSGLRLSELHALNWQDFSADLSEVRVLGKGGKERLLPVTVAAQSALTRWQTVQNAPSPAAVFTHKKGAQLSRLSRRSVQQYVSQWAAQQALGQHLHPHRLRHAFASHLLSESDDIRAVQELLGHQSLNTTQIYTHLDWKKLAASYDASHPRAKQKEKT
jgi:integrase/recombinase XerC